MFRTLLSVVLALSVVSTALAAEDAKPAKPKSNASVKPVSPAPKAPPYNPVAERAKFFVVAGKDNEIDAKEFAAAKGKEKGFVRKDDSFSAMLKHDKDTNGKLSWFEADAFRRGQKLVKQVTVTTIDGKAVPGAGGGSATQRRGWGMSDPETVKKFDKDGDGKLSRDESRAAWGARAEEMRQNFMKTHDKNGDGKIDDEERKAVREAFTQRAREWGQRMRERRYDKDGDGKLSDEEKAAMDTAEAARKAEGEKRRKEFMGKYDTDGNGELSSEERGAIGADMRRRWTERRYDKDRDGTLNDEEKAAMEKGQAERSATEAKRREDYTKKYDKDGDGKISDEERNAARQAIRDRFRGGRNRGATTPGGATD